MYFDKIYDFNLCFWLYNKCFDHFEILVVWFTFADFGPKVTSLDS